MDKEAKCEKQQGLGHMEGDGDAVSCTTDTSRWSSPSRLSCGSESPRDSSDCEDKAGSLIGRTPDALPPVKGQGLKKSGEKSRENDKKVPNKQSFRANHQKLKLPPIKPLQVSKPKIQPDSLTSIGELKNQVCDLQQQLKEARTENKLLKRLQHRHMMALQYFQNSEKSVSQVFKKHNNEVRALQRLLNETRSSRDKLARQLQASENKLWNTETILQHLQQLSQNHSLLQREELTLRLAEATAQLETKDKRILDMKKNLELSQASLKRQIATEQRKINEERKLTCHLQNQIYQLNQKLKDKEKELEKLNVYSQRFLKGSNKKGRKNKLVQTDGLVFLPTDVARLLEIEYSATEERLEHLGSSVNWCCSTPVQTDITTDITAVIETPEEEVSANVTLEENHQQDAVICPVSDTSEDSRCSEESPEHLDDGDCAKEKEASEVPQVFEEKQETQHESTVAYILEESLNSTEHKRKAYQLPKVRRKYIFKQSTEDLHNGRPVSSSVDKTSCESTRSTVKVEDLGGGVSDLHLSGGKSRGGGADGSQWE